MAKYDENGVLMLSSVQKSEEQIKADLGLNTFQKETLEIARGLPRGAVKGLKETAKLAPLAVQYAPFVAMPFEYAGRKIGGFFGDDDQDNNYSWSSEVGDYKRLVKDWGDFANLEDARQNLDDLAQPLIDSLEKEYETTFGDYSELLGEFASPFAPLKAVTMGARAFRVKNILPQIKESKNKILNELNQKTNKQLDESAIVSPRKAYETLKKEGIKLDSDAERQLALLHKNQKKVNQLEAYNKASLRAKNILTRDIASAASAAAAVHYVENNFDEETSLYLAPLAGILSAIFAPPLFIGHGRAGFYKLLEKYQTMRGNDDVALDMAIRSRGIDVDEIRKADGSKVTDPDELRRRKQEMLASGPAEIKFYKMLNEEIEKLPPQEKAAVMASLDHYTHLYEKFRQRALDKNRKELADNFIPLVGNVLQLNSIRSLHKTLMGSLNQQLFVDPRKRIFRSRVGNELDDMTNMLAQQAELVRLEFEDLKKLGRLTDPTTGKMYDEIDVLLSDFKKIDLDTRDYLDAVNGQIGEGSKNILKRLEIGTVGKRDAEAQLAGTKAIQNLTKKYNIDRSTKYDNINEGKADIFYRSFNKAQQNVNDAYEGALKDNNGQWITLKSKESLDKLENLLSEKMATSVLVEKGKPPVSLLKMFQKDLQEEYITDFLKTDFDKSKGFLEDITDFYEANLQAYLISKKIIDPATETRTKGITSDQLNNAISEFKSRSGYANFLKHKTSYLENGVDHDKLAKFINKQFISAGPDGRHLHNADEYQKADSTIINNFISQIKTDGEGASIRLIDIHRLRSQYNEQKLFGRSAAVKADGEAMLDILDDFFDKDMVENVEVMEKYVGNLRVANKLWREEMLPYKAQAYQEFRRKHLEAMSLEEDYQTAKDLMKSGNVTKMNELSKRVAYKRTDGDDLMRALIDPKTTKDSVGKSPDRVLNSVMKNLDEADRKEISDSVIKSITRALYEGENSKNLSFINQVNKQYLDNMQGIGVIKKEDRDILENIAEYNHRAYKDYNSSQEKVFKDATNAITSIGRKYGDSIEKSIVRAVLKAQNNANNAGKPGEIVKELTNLTIGKSGTLKGFKSFVREVDADEGDYNFIKRILEEEDTKNGTNFLNEAQDFLYGEDGSTTGLQRLFDYYKKGEGKGKTIEVVNSVTKQTESITEGQLVLNAIDDIFMQHLIDVGFSATDTMSSLQNMNVFTRRGRKHALNYQQNINAAGLQEAAEDIKPYLEALHGQDSKILSEIEDLLEVKKIVSQKPFTKDDATLKGMPTMMSVESGISRMYSVIRGVVSARYILTEMGLRNYRLGQKELLTKFLTDPTAVHVLHDVAVKGLDDPYHTRSLFDIIFSTPNMAIVAARASEVTGANNYSTVSLTTDEGKKIRINKQWKENFQKAMAAM